MWSLLLRADRLKRERRRAQGQAHGDGIQVERLKRRVERLEQEGDRMKLSDATPTLLAETWSRYNARLRHGHILVPDDELRRAFKKRATRDDGLAGRPQLLSLLEELYGSLRVKVRALEKHADCGSGGTGDLSDRDPFNIIGKGYAPKMWRQSVLACEERHAGDDAASHVDRKSGVRLLFNDSGKADVDQFIYLCRATEFDIMQKLNIATHGQGRNVRTKCRKKMPRSLSVAAHINIRPELTQISLDCVGPSFQRRLSGVNVDIREPLTDLKARLEFLLAVPSDATVLIYNGQRLRDGGCLESAGLTLQEVLEHRRHGKEPLVTAVLMS